MMPQSWRVELLGGFCLTCGSERVTHFRTRKATVLLAYLVLHPHRHSRDSLTDLLWPDADFEAARASFRVTLSHLRKALGDDFLDTTRDSVGIRALFTCDATEFQQAVGAKRWTEAARLYRGELLPGFWDDRILAERERLADLFEIVRKKTGRTTSAPSLYLPPEQNRFFGRDDEIEQMAALLAENRLVTLLGPGGVGKTRLSLAIARRHAALFPGGLWFIPLADVVEPERFLPTLRDALGLSRDPRAEPRDQITDFLSGDLPCLLLLDNLEQIASGSGPILAALMARIPNLTCLVTSRRRLGIPGERQKTVAPLDIAPSVALFCDRAQADPTDDIRALCSDLEGVPLAIELCAARAGVFTVAEMREKLGEPFTLLWSTQPDKSSRHRSLFAAIQWSYHLLTPEQRRFFGQLSVFCGGWTREAAESVCEEQSAGEYLAQLRERSLLVSEEKNGAIRFRLLETLRVFASERLTTSDRAALEQRHSAYFQSFAAAQHAALEGAEAGHALDRLEADHDNFRVILDRQEGAVCISLIGDLWKFWETRGHYGEGRKQISAALQTTDAAAGDDDRARAFSALGSLSYAQGDHDAALSAHEEAVRIARDVAVAAKARNNLALTFLRMGRLDEAEQAFERAHADFVTLQNRAGQSATLNNLAIARRRQGDFVGARTALEAAIRLDRESNNRQSLAFCLNGLALVLIQSGCPDEAEACFTESLAIKRELNDRAGVVSALANLGILSAEQGRFDRSRTLQCEALQLRIEMGLRHGILESLSGFALLATATGDFSRAATLLGSYCSFAGRLGSPISEQERTESESAPRAALGEKVFGECFSRGEALSEAEAASFALAL
ncbi:MAG: tetratricopeptide repeat protein [Armatimonadota bacterium]